MPRLDEVLGNELAQTGDEDGFELFRQLVRKLDPPKADVAFDMKAEIEGLGKRVCSNCWADGVFRGHARHAFARLRLGNWPHLPA